MTERTTELRRVIDAAKEHNGEDNILTVLVRPDDHPWTPHIYQTADVKVGDSLYSTGFHLYAPVAAFHQIPEVLHGVKVKVQSSKHIPTVKIGSRHRPLVEATDLDAWVVELARAEAQNRTKDFAFREFPVRAFFVRKAIPEKIVERIKDAETGRLTCTHFLQLLAVRVDNTTRGN